MKIALCLSGIPRFWDRFDISDYGNVDIYIHSWLDTSSSGCLSGNHPNSLGLKYKFDFKILDKFRPKDIKLEKLSNFDFDSLYTKFKNLDGDCRKSVIPMFYSISESIKLVKEKYDIIIRSRFDVRLFQPLNLKISDDICIPDQFHYKGVCDQIAYGNMDNMKIYAGISDYLKTEPKININPELLLYKWLYINKIKINLTQDYFVLLR